MELYFHETDRDVLILSADDGLNGDHSVQLTDELERVVAAGARNVVDCGRLRYISSSSSTTAR